MLSPALSKLILDVHPWSDSTDSAELAEAVPIGKSCRHMIFYIIITNSISLFSLYFILLGTVPISPISNKTTKTLSLTMSVA